MIYIFFMEDSFKFCQLQVSSSNLVCVTKVSRLFKKKWKFQNILVIRQNCGSQGIQSVVTAPTKHFFIMF